jgi:SecD/SecF fusion protein
MKHFGRPFALIALATALALLAIYPPREKIKLGIDLSGGTILVYQAKDADRPEFDINELVAALKRRINPDGTQDIIIREVGQDRVEIILPKASEEEVEEVKRKMTAVGAMQFRVLADRRDQEDAPRIERAMAEGGLSNPPPRYAWAKLAEIVTAKKPAGASSDWVRIEGNRFIDPSRNWERDRYVGAGLTLIDEEPGGTTRRITFPVIASDANSLILDPQRAQVREGNRLVNRKFARVSDAVRDVDQYQLVLNPSRILDDPYLAIRSVDRGNGVEERYVLYKAEAQPVTGDMLERVYPTEDSRLQPAVGFVFRPQGANRFGRLTREYSPGQRGGDFQYHLAILLDDLVMSAPVIRQEIRDNGIIEGMTPRQRDELIDILRAGKLPASIDPIPLQQESIGPTLGRDTIEKGLRAILVSMCVVPLFMIAYYRFAGVIAVIALVLNTLLLVGSMAWTRSSFTLPGLAGLALTIGMAVDANVLIFERMREEKARGANLGTQIRNGFGRAWSAILDSNLTTVLTAAILWAIGTEEIKGFATTLTIGLVWNLFTAVYVSRVLFEFCYQKGWLKRLNFAQILGKTEINFVRPRRIFQLISLILIVLGVASFVSQGGRNFNIDFTGGTLVTIALDPNHPDVAGKTEAQRLAWVRQQASQARLPDGSPLPNITVESLTVTGEKVASRFNIRTSYTDQELSASATGGERRNAALEVQQAILDQFGDALARLSLRIGDPVPIPKVEGTTPDRFAGGLEFPIELNRPVNPERIQQELVDALSKEGIDAPASHVEVVRAPRSSSESDSETQHRLLVRTDLERDVVAKALESARDRLLADRALMLERRESFGAAVARDTQTLALVAIVLSWLAIIAYVWIRFKSIGFGLAAVLALVHDVLIALGAVAISPYKIDLPMIAAFLTIIGFSVNDTIVIFDRIREIRGKSPHLTEGIVNAALNQTLSRTILTSLTALVVVAILYAFGGESLKGFSFCLLAGMISGVYSTVYIASPFLIDWYKARGSARPQTPAPAAASR